MQLWTYDGATRSRLGEMERARRDALDFEEPGTKVVSVAMRNDLTAEQRIAVWDRWPDLQWHEETNIRLSTTDVLNDWRADWQDYLEVEFTWVRTQEEAERIDRAREGLDVLGIDLDDPDAREIARDWLTERGFLDVIDEIVDDE